MAPEVAELWADRDMVSADGKTRKAKTRVAVCLCRAVSSHHKPVSKVLSQFSKVVFVSEQML